MHPSTGNKLFVKTSVTAGTLLSLQNTLKSRISIAEPHCFKKTLFTPQTPFVPTKQNFSSLMPKLHKHFLGIKLIFALHFPAALKPNKAQFYTSLPF